MNGELSIKHSLQEGQCRSCHKPWKGVSNQPCVECHEQTSRSHFIEKDFSDVPGHPVKKVTCLHCHKEHKGVTHNLKVVDNPTCLKYHPLDFMLGRKFKVIH